MGNQGDVNMAAAVGRVLSFSKNAKVLLSPLRLSAVPVHRYSVEVSSTGEAITHTGQVSLNMIIWDSLFHITGWTNIMSVWGFEFTPFMGEDAKL